MIGEMYSLPSLHCTWVMSVSSFANGLFAWKSCLSRFSDAIAAGSAFVSPFGLRLRS